MKFASGYTPGPEGRLIPPGWRIVRDLPALTPSDASGEDEPGPD